METKLIFAVILLWGVCLAVAFPHRPETAFERASKLQLDAFTATANVTCQDDLSCAGEDDDCIGDQLNMNGCNVSNASCCALGLLCLEGECKTDNMGDDCNNTLDCHTTIAAPYDCVSGECQYVYGPGDSCSSNSDCMGSLNCTGSVCVGLSVGMTCTAGQCGFGLSCNASNMCANDVPQGGDCTGVGAVCYPGTFCSGGKCVKYFSIAAGGSCAGFLACETGLTCAPNKTCVTATTSISSCSTNSDCNNGIVCVCSQYTGEFYCADPLWNPCSDQESDLESCLVDSNCTTAYGSPDSCAYSNCYSDLKKSNSCACDDLDTIFSSCFYNTYCGGFPVWAIIVIIIVAIVLVLAIVLLVFFMMRRRRVYDSI